MTNYALDNIYIIAKVYYSSEFLFSYLWDYILYYFSMLCTILHVVGNATSAPIISYTCKTSPIQVLKLLCTHRHPPILGIGRKPFIFQFIIPSYRYPQPQKGKTLFFGYFLFMMWPTASMVNGLIVHWLGFRLRYRFRTTFGCLFRIFPLFLTLYSELYRKFACPSQALFFLLRCWREGMGYIYWKGVTEHLG